MLESFQSKPFMLRRHVFPTFNDKLKCKKDCINLTQSRKLISAYYNVYSIIYDYNFYINLSELNCFLKIGFCKHFTLAQSLQSKLISPKRPLIYISL